MKKRVIILVIVLIGMVGWAGATYLISGQVEQRYRDYLARFEKWGPIEVTGESFQRGFFSSEGRTLVTLSLPIYAEELDEIETQSVQLTLEHHICNGPLPVGAGSFSLVPKLARIETRLVAMSVGGEDLLDKLPWLAEISDQTSIGLDGSGRELLVVPAIEKTIEEEQFSISWGGLRSDTVFAGDLTTLAGTVEVSPLKILVEDGRLQWDGAQLAFDLQEAFPMLYVGNYHGNSGLIALEFNEAGVGPQKLQIEGAAIDCLASQNDSTVEYLQTLKVAKVDVNGEGYGPGEMKVAVRGLDGEAVSRYQKDVLEVYGQGSFDPDAIGLQIMQVYMQLLSSLVQGSPEIEFSKLQFATPNGDFNGNLRIKLNGEADLDLSDIPALLQKLEGQAQLTVDETLFRKVMIDLIAREKEKSYRHYSELDLEPPSEEELAAKAAAQVDKQLKALIDQQLIERSEGKLRCQAVFDRGELKVNGQKM